MKTIFQIGALVGIALLLSTQPAVSQDIEAFMEEIQNELNIAEIRLLDMKPELDLTDDQIIALKPVLSSGMKSVLQTLYEYGDKRMGVWMKIKVGKQLKQIQTEMDTGIRAVLRDEQQTAFEAYREAPKAA